MPAGKRAMEECDPLGLLTCVVATHMSNKRYGETYSIITAVRNFYNNKMTQHEDLAAYYSRCRTLLFVKSEAIVGWQTKKRPNTQMSSMLLYL